MLSNELDRIVQAQAEADSDANEAPQPSSVTIESPAGAVSAVVDPYSDRIRCDHPSCEDGEALGEALLELADQTGRSRIVALVKEELSPGLLDVGYEIDGVMPGFYRGESDCVVLGLATDDERGRLANPIEVSRVDALLEQAPPPRDRPPTPTERAVESDAGAIAALMATTFDEYPTPSGEPDYVRKQLNEGIPFRVVREGDDIVACASADLVRDALSAELTDCATVPDHRGRGYMQFILAGLIDDVRTLGYPTVFTLARARIAGVNLAFQRLGFEFRGRMAQSCRIGDGIEDMNIWSRETATY